MSNPLFKYFTENRNPIEKRLLRNNLPAIKIYARSTRVSLPIPDEGSVPVTQLLQQRKSDRSFFNTSLSLSDLSHILYWSLSEQVYRGSQEADFKRRPYPSGGAKFPVETYLFTDSHATLGSGAYHYRPDTHQLEKVADLTAINIQEIKNMYGYAFVRDIPILCLFSYIRERNIPKYGLFGEKLALIESGHMAQNIYLCATEKKVSAVALGGGGDDLAAYLLKLDSYNESIFYTVGLGKHYS